MQSAETKRNLQYLKVLKTQKQNMVLEQKELESQVAQLRKNPADKLTTDLYIFQYNKKIESLKEDISSTNKEILRVTKELENADFSDLEEDDIEEYSEEIKEIFPEEEQSEQDIVVELPQTKPEKKPSNFKLLLLSFSKAKLILLTICTLLSAWILYQIDASNMITMVSRFTKFTIFSFLLVGIFFLLIISFSAYNKITSRPFGNFRDFFNLYLFLLSIILISLFIREKSFIKLLCFAFLAIYSLVFFGCRLAFYGKTSEELIQNKPRFIKYYYNLFKKYSIYVISLLAIVGLCALYISIIYQIIPKWLNKRPTFFNSKLWMIIDLVLLGLFIAYGIAFSIINIKENDLKIIDLMCFITQIICLEFAFLAIVQLHTLLKPLEYVIFATLFIISIGITTYRIKNLDRNEV